MPIGNRETSATVGIGTVTPTQTATQFPDIRPPGGQQGQSLCAVFVPIPQSAADIATEWGENAIASGAITTACIVSRTTRNARTARWQVMR